MTRQTLVDELFTQADDPMGALRWSLAELRRRLGAPEAFHGNPLTGDLGPGIEVDVTVAARGRFAGPPPEGRLLEGVEVRDSAAFDTWLLIERERVDAKISSGIHEATIQALANGDAERAIDLARALISRDELDEGPHVLLVSALAAAGRYEAAAQQAEASAAMLLRELGVSPSASLRNAARPPPRRLAVSISPQATIATMRASGLAALSAGVPDAGIERLRAAAAAADEAGDPAVTSECLLELGTALVHGAHCNDDEGAVVLGSALAVALDAGHDAVASRALAELAYVDVLAGRRVPARTHLESAREIAANDRGLLATVASIEASDLHDQGHLGAALERFEESLAHSQATGKVRREAWAWGVGARTQYWLGDYAAAERWSRQALELVEVERWAAFRPWVESCVAHAELALGCDPAAVRAGLESTFALARELSDACYQGASAKAMALACDALGDRDGARAWLRTAAAACARETDAYVWVRADVALATAELALTWGDRALALEQAEEVRTIAVRCCMDGMLARASMVLDRVAPGRAPAFSGAGAARR
ncbi:bacterial transcriptional activator domain-containing protein [Demequina muriae]|uniref:Bacterial transcriptional activator domain-containing protein n=1 Tax=Demequina muriae TaxID=3051664 RepID=A0ABT8GIP5_9MICO|nr:bacterial transcriptional activator domain-containing protein [Demequina sp. EGI L300058]MDN4481254.1 bacterial transcriptional activator domain-containing protein [Demequina sp. EGI L300058]